MQSRQVSKSPPWSRWSLEDERSFQLGGSLGDGLNDLHIVDVESADGISAFVSLHQHFFGVYKSHFKYPFVFDIISLNIILYHSGGTHIKRRRGFFGKFFVISEGESEFDIRKSDF